VTKYKRQSAFNQEDDYQELIQPKAFMFAWKAVGKGTGCTLHGFLEGLATVLPGTANVESDSSFVNCEKCKDRTSTWLPDSPLEGIRSPLKAKSRIRQDYSQMHPLEIAKNRRRVSARLKVKLEPKLTYFRHRSAFAENNHASRSADEIQFNN
jgi:hypothetical protein